MKIGILRIDINIPSEFFIKEEAQNFVAYKPLYFCGTVKKLNGNKEDYFCENYLKIPLKNFHLPVFPKKSIQRFYEIACREKVSLLHSQFLTDTVSYLPLIKRLNLPLVVNFRGYELSDSRSVLFFSKVEPFVTQIITKSNFQKKELIKRGIGEEKIEVIYGGINIDKIPFKFRKLEKDRLRLLSAGRFVEKKGFDVTLKSFKEILRRYPYSRLALIGEGPGRQIIEENINKLDIQNYVEIKDFMPHSKFVRELFNHDIFILPCKTASNGDREGIPNVLKEAMASGMPVISTYHAGIPELIENESTGFLVRENDFQDIIDKVKWILENSKKALGICLNARFFAEKNFNIKKTTRQVELLYDKLLMPDFVKTVTEVMEERRPIKFRADLHLISGCNGKCIMCDNWKNKISSSFSKEDVLRLLDDLKSFGVDYVRFHGQEPTLRKDLFPIMEGAKKKGFKVGLKTNALIFNNDKKIKILSRNVDDLYLSLDSPIKKIHNLLRGKKESFARNIKITRAIKKINPNIRIYFNAVVTRFNYKSLAGLLELAFLLKVDKVSFVNLNPNNKRNIENLRLTKQQIKDFYFNIWPHILKKSQEFRIPVSINPYFLSLVGLPLDSQIKKLKDNQEEFEEEINNFYKGLYGKKFYTKNTCYGVLDHITIDWEGNIYPCCAMPRLTGLSIGNVLKNSFLDIWNSEKYIKYREDVLQGRCKFRNQCSRNFRETLEINNCLKNSFIEDNNGNILDEFLNQFKHIPHISQYKLKMRVYYAFFKSNFYRSKFKGNLELGKKIDISKLPVVKREDLKRFFPNEEVVPNYFGEDYGIFRTSSCGQKAFLYARSLKSKRFPRMATCFLNTGIWRIADPWLKLTAVNCLETVQPLYIKSNSSRSENSKKGNGTAIPPIVIPPSENFLKESISRIKQIYSLIKNSNTYLVHANPTYLKLLLYRFRQEGLILKNHYAVNSTYETILPSTKRLIEKYLDCDVYDQYGCSEIGPISFTCKYGNYHIFSDSVYVEVIPAKDLGRDNIGRIVVTDLENRVMPFVKYFTGDFAYVVDKKECECDLSTPLMGRIVGREDEMINYKGKIVFPLELDDLLSDLENILMYQIFFGNEQFFIMIVPEDTSKTIDVSNITHRFKDFFKDKECEVNVEIVETILPGRRGKYKTVLVK